MANLELNMYVQNSSSGYDKLNPTTTAEKIAYVNTTSGLTADDVQSAIDELDTQSAYQGKLLNDSLTKFYPVIGGAHLLADGIFTLTKAQLATSVGIDASRIVAIIPILGACNISVHEATIIYNRYGTNDKVEILSTIAQEVYYVIYVVYK